jgi:uncharacterized membrane protein YfcA
VDDLTLIFCLFLFAISILYSCVGQAGASGYIAAMVLFGFAPASIKPTALVLNILVSLIVSFRFYRAGHFSLRLFWPFAVASIPFAALGGFLTLSPRVFNLVLGILLLVAAVPLLFRQAFHERPVNRPALSLALISGSFIGFLAGLTGVGGGVLIAPLLLLTGWARTKIAAAVSSFFILINSVAALAGHLSATRELPANLPVFALAALLGAVIGSELGSRHLSTRTIQRILGVVLLLSAIKLIIS